MGSENEKASINPVRTDQVLVYFPASEIEVGLKQTGGKAGSLLQLSDRGFLVPDFFVITTLAHSISDTGAVSQKLRNEIRVAYERIGGDENLYAVRSSSIAEDSSEYSFAGVFDSVLNVSGMDNIVSAIKHCWSSHESEIANAYRQGRHVGEDAYMAVIVQKMVDAEWSGVSFSADPVTQCLSTCVINSTPGIGEDMISGRVNPEEIKIDINSGVLLEHQLPENHQATPEKVIQEIVKLTVEARDAFNFPQDLEWAYQSGRLYLLQSRPITTVAGVYYNRFLEPWAGQGNPDDPRRVWTRAYADEVWTPPVSPLFYDIQDLTAITAQRLRSNGDRRELPTDVFKYFKATPYMDASVLQRLFEGLPRFARTDSLLRMLPPEWREDALKSSWSPLSLIGRTFLLEFKHGARFGLNRNYKYLERAWPGFVDKAESMLDKDISLLNGDALKEHQSQIWELAGSVARECEVAVLYYAQDIKLILVGLLEKWCGEGEHKYAEVSGGLEKSATVLESSEIWDVASIVQDDERIKRKVLSSSWSEYSSLAIGEKEKSVDTKLKIFLGTHRHRGANYKDPVYSRWGDDPEMLWSHLKGFVKSDMERPSLANEKAKERRIRAQNQALQDLKPPFRLFKRYILRSLFYYNEIYAAIRDNHRFYYDYIWTLLRLYFMEVGIRLTEQGKLHEAEDIFFLSRSEIDAVWGEQITAQSAAERIDIRRSEWKETKKLASSMFLRNGYVSDHGDSLINGEGACLQGLAASDGTAKGIARVLFDVSELDRVEKGEILVTRQTDPGWTPAFSRLGGLVLETGGLLAHGASLCREYGLPCVTSVHGATKIIADGDLIQISGGTGSIYIVKE